MRLKTKNLRSILILAALLITLAVLSAVSCAPSAPVAKGWAGVAVSGNRIYVASMDGKLIALDASTRVRLWSDHPFTLPPPSGSFAFLSSCSAGPGTVAIYGTPVVDKDLVYIAGYDGKVYALNAGTGADRWIYPRQGALQPIVGGLLLSSGRLYFGDSSGKIYALDAATGDLVWEAQTGDDIWSSAAVEGGTLYIGSFDKKLHAHDTATGALKWTTETGGAIASSPVVRGSLVYIGSFDRKLYAVEATTGKVKWASPESGNWFWSRPIITDSTVYAGSLDGKIYAFNADSGAKVAEIDLGGPVSASPVLSEGAIVAATEAGQVYAIDTKTNQKRQIATLKENVYAPLTADGPVVYVHSAKDTVHAINSQSGTALWNLPLNVK